MVNNFALVQLRLSLYHGTRTTRDLSNLCLIEAEITRLFLSLVRGSWKTMPCNRIASGLFNFLFTKKLIIDLIIHKENFAFWKCPYRLVKKYMVAYCSQWGCLLVARQSKGIKIILKYQQHFNSGVKKSQMQAVGEMRWHIQLYFSTVFLESFFFFRKGKCRQRVK